MFEAGHFCLLIFAQGTWKEKFKDTFVKKVKSDFLSLLEPTTEGEAIKLGWDEIPKDPLFNPKIIEGTKKECELCSVSYNFFKEKKGSNDGLILFSHSVPYVDEIKSFFTNLLKDNRIKKLCYLELDFELTYYKREEAIAKINEKKEKQLNLSDFFHLLDTKQVECGVLYEIMKKYF